MNRTTVLTALTAAGLLVADAPAHASSSPTASAAACLITNQTQSITQRKNISCPKARKTTDRAFAAAISIPECTHQKTVHWNGWTIKGLGSRADHTGIATRFEKGKVSFVVAGGGTC